MRYKILVMLNYFQAIELMGKNGYIFYLNNNPEGVTHYVKKR